MLQFLRRHQHYFFVVITIVVVISFSFFGTQGTIDYNHPGDRVVTQAVDGSRVRHSDVEEMAMFLGSDETDKLMWGGAWGPNFLNDGVIANDFLKTGLAAELLRAYPQGTNADLQQRLERERRLGSYVHPTVPFISAQSVWSYLAPQMAASMTELRSAKDAMDPAAFAARVNLYLGERDFPAPALRQVLQYQQQQYQWVTPDPNLDRLDLSIYGYHTLEDWFGPNFVRLVSQFVINAAKIAERKGYHVSRDEAAADLVHRAQLSYDQVKKLPSLGVTSPDQYLQMQVQRMGMDENRAIGVWRQVLLFRRLFDGVGNAVFVDAVPFEGFNQYALQQVDGTIYQLPQQVWLANARAAQRFQVYLDAVAKGKLESPLAIPNEFVSADELRKLQPTLVQKRYLLGVTEASANALQSQVTLRATWDWQVQDANWQKLKKEFPELGVTSTATVSERLNALEALPATTRARVDAMARKAIVAEHPEWLDKAFAEATEQVVTVGIRPKGGILPIHGIENRDAFIAALDKAPLGGEDPSTELQRYSGDGQSFYRIRVLDRAKNWEILTFSEASQDDTLDGLVMSTLEPYYAKVRESNSDQFRKSDGAWRALTDVRDAVADLYFKDLFTALENEAKRNSDGQLVPRSWSANNLAAYRFFPYMRGVLDRIKKNPSDDSLWASAEVKADADKLAPAKPLADQWKVVKKTEVISRADDRVQGNKDAVFALAPQAWTDVMTRPSGDVWFFQVTAKGGANTVQATDQQIAAVRAHLAGDAEKWLMRHVLKEIKDKNAINLAKERRENDGE